MLDVQTQEMVKWDNVSEKSFNSENVGDQVSVSSFDWADEEYNKFEDKIDESDDEMRDTDRN